MKRRFLFTLFTAHFAALALCLLPSLSARAQSQTTVVDQFSLYAGQESVAISITRDPTGNLYTAGYSKIPPAGASIVYYPTWVVRKSADGGVTWNTVDTPTLSPPGKQSIAESVIADAFGNIYVSGSAHDSSNVSHAYIRKSADAGATWATVMNFNYVAGYFTNAKEMGIDNLGNLYVAGYGKTKRDGVFGLVRRSANQGATWTTVDAFQMVAKQRAEATAIATDPVTGAVYVTGMAQNSAGVPKQIVRKSTNGGLSFTLLASSPFSLVGGTNTVPTSITVDGSGRVFTAANAMDSAGVSHAVIRRSVDGGATFTTVSDYQLQAGYHSGNASIIVNSVGQILAGGHGTTPSDTHAIVRVSSDGGNTWYLYDDFMPAGSSKNSVMGLVDLNGTLYGSGPISDAAGVRIWAAFKY